MNKRGGLIPIAIIALLLVSILPGCSSPPPSPPPPPIQYDIAQGAEVTNVSWYINQDVLVFDITVKNTSSAVKKYDVGLKVDDGAFYYAGAETKEVKAGTTLKYQLQSNLTQPYPARLSIRVGAVQ